MHNIYDLNEAYEGFIKRFGIEPNGVLMHEETYKMLCAAAPSIPLTFRGAPIYTSPQMEVNQLRFII